MEDCPNAKFVIRPIVFKSLRIKGLDPKEDLALKKIQKPIFKKAKMQGLTFDPACALEIFLYF